MKLDKKKELAVKTLGVGKSRIIFNTTRLDDIKEAITKQDIKDLQASGAITVKQISGSKTKKKRRTRRRAGSIKKKVSTKKKDYMALTRKLRIYLSHLKRAEVITAERYQTLRKQIRAKIFRSKAHLKERVAGEAK